MPPVKPDRMTGQPLARDISLPLLLGGHGPAWFQVATGQADPILGLPRSSNGYQFIRISGGWAAQPFPVDPGCDNCAPGPLPVYYLADESRVASRVGTADFAVPAAIRGALWLVSYRRGADLRTAAGRAQEVSVTGAALGPRLELPAGYAIDQETRAGLLLVREAAGSGPVRYELWDPGTRRAERSFVNLIATSPAEIAWADCIEGCQVHVMDLASGSSRQFPLPRQSTAYAGAFSPDGRFLALLVTARITATGQAAAIRLTVATVASGQLTAVPGTMVGSGNGVSFGWRAGSHQLIADLASDTPGQSEEWQIAVWQPGDARLSTTLVRIPENSWPVIDQGPY